MVIYVVQKGDTIYSIAQRYGMSSEELAFVNGIEPPYNLVVGQTVVIPNGEEKEGTLAVNGYLYPNIDREVLLKTLPYLTFITIFTYGFNEQGELNEIDDQEIIDIARANKVAPIMLISTLTEDGTFSNELAHSILNNLEAQENLIENILQNLKNKNYFGLDIDFEFIYPEDREAFVEFIRRTTTRLNEEGYPVITALAPKTSSEQQGLLYEAHDYKAIGEASNTVLLMTYEWGYTYDNH